MTVPEVLRSPPPPGQDSGIAPGVGNAGGSGCQLVASLCCRVARQRSRESRSGLRAESSGSWIDQLPLGGPMKRPDRRAKAEIPVQFETSLGDPGPALYRAPGRPADPRQSANTGPKRAYSEFIHGLLPWWETNDHKWPNSVSFLFPPPGDIPYSPHGVFRP